MTHVRRLAALVLLGAGCLPAFAEDPVTPAAAYDAKRASLPAPSAAAGYAFDGEFVADGGQLKGSAKLRASVAKVGEATGWSLRLELSSKVLSLEETGLYDAQLRPVSGMKKTSGAGNKHVSWERVEGGVLLTDHAAAEDGGEAPSKILKHAGAFQ
jgi:hypothetical protein